MLGFSGAQELRAGWRNKFGSGPDAALVIDLSDRHGRVKDHGCQPHNSEIGHVHLSSGTTSLDPVPSALTPELIELEIALDSSFVEQGYAPEIVEPEPDRQSEFDREQGRVLHVLPRSDRRAVGRSIEVFSHGLDFLAFVGSAALLIATQNQVVAPKPVLLYGVIGTLLLWSTMRRGRLAVRASEGLLSTVGRVCLAPVFTLMVVACAKVLIGWSYDTVDVFALAALAGVAVPAVIVSRLISTKLVDLVRHRGYDLEDVIIVGTGPVGVQVAEALVENPQFGLVPFAFVDRYTDQVPLPIIGRPEDLRQILSQTGVRHVVLAFGAADEDELVGIVRDCQDQIVQFYAVPRLFELGVSADHVGQEVSGLPIVEVRRPGTAAALWPAKRVFDFVTAGIITVLALPILIACALAVRLTSRGPIFFRQVRIGIGGVPFEILKFRTMRVNDDSSTQWTVDDDDRVTRVGRILRPTHLDELPQLINVLKGEMSLVGPRPERPHFVEQFSSEIDDYQFRHRVPVGITGWAQVNGYWGDTSIETRVRLDNRYIENWSLWRDLVIALRTIPTLLGKRR